MPPTPLNPENLAEAAEELRSRAQSLTDLKTWFEENAHLLCEIPENMLPLVTVKVDLHYDSLSELIEKKALWLTVIFDVPKDEKIKNPLEETFSLVRDDKKSFYNRFYHMPLSFVKWPLCTAMLAHAYYEEYNPEAWYNEQARTKLEKFLPIFFPSLTLEALDALNSGSLLPSDKNTFVKFMFDSRTRTLTTNLPTDAPLL